MEKRNGQETLHPQHGRGRQIPSHGTNLVGPPGTDLSSLKTNLGSNFSMRITFQGMCKPLHSMNKLRVQLIREGLAATEQIAKDYVGQSRMLEGLSILDVGCGGGILSEPLARLGANVIGLDAAQESIDIAAEHCEKDPEIKDNLCFLCSTIEDFAAENPDQKFNAVVASEVLEHVEHQAEFVKTCSSLLVPKGSFFLSTLNRTKRSYLSGIVAAESILGLLPVGTHDWHKFVTPEELDKMLIQAGCQMRLIHGMFYWPVSNTWTWIPDAGVNYAVHAIKH